jgi:hypothetical protein
VGDRDLLLDLDLDLTLEMDRDTGGASWFSCACSGCGLDDTTLAYYVGTYLDLATHVSEASVLLPGGIDPRPGA